MKTNRLHTESTQLSARWRAPVSTGGRVRRAWTFRGGTWHGPSMWLRTVLGLNLEMVCVPLLTFGRRVRRAWTIRAGKLHGAMHKFLIMPGLNLDIGPLIILHVRRNEHGNNTSREHATTQWRTHKASKQYGHNGTQDNAQHRNATQTKQQNNTLI